MSKVRAIFEEYRMASTEDVIGPLREADDHRDACLREMKRVKAELKKLRSEVEFERRHEQAAKLVERAITELTRMDKMMGQIYDNVSR